MKRWLRPLGLLVACGVLVTGCGSTPDRDAGSSDSLPDRVQLADNTNQDATFRWAYPAYPNSWDPVESVSGVVLTWYYPVYDRLLDADSDGALKPMLATAYEPSDDGLSVTLKLQDGLTFSDGTPFDAEAVKFNLDRAAAQGSTVANEISTYVSTDVVDGATVKITTSGGLGSFLTALTARAGVMVSPTAALAGTLTDEPVGVGPYTTTAINAGDSVEYVKTDGYWDPDSQQVADLSYRLMADDQSRLNALQTGAIDGAYLTTSQIESAKNMDLQVIVRPSTVFDFLAVNSAEAPFDDPMARLALNYAIDREGIAEGMFDGHCTPQIQPWPSDSPAYNDDIGDGSSMFPYDPQKAKELLAEAGVTDGASVTLVAVNIPTYQKLAEVIQESLAEVGISVQVTNVPPTQLVQDFGIDKSAEMTAGPYTGFADPFGVSSRYLATGAPYNPGAPVAQEILDIAAEGANAVDHAERKKAYEGLMPAMLDNPTHLIPICMEHRAAAYAQNVSNVEVLSSGQTPNRGVAING